MSISTLHQKLATFLKIYFWFQIHLFCFFQAFFSDMQLLALVLMILSFLENYNISPNHTSADTVWS